MEISIALSSLFVSFCALALSIHALHLKRGTHKKESRDALGRKYAALAWAYARAQKDSVDPAKARKHAEQAFVLADKSADGKRDFTDTQAALYISEAQ